MAVCSYIRCSSAAGSWEYQKEAIGSVDKEFSDIVTGTSRERDGLNALLAFVREGDIVKVHSISRLGRSLRLILEIVDEFNKRGVQLVSIKEAIDTTTPVGRLVLNVLSSVAELEREQIIEKLQSARKISKVKQGRKPTVHTKRDAIKELLSRGNLTDQKIMESVGVSRGSYYKLKKEIESP